MKIVKIYNGFVTYTAGDEIITVPMTPMAKQVLNYYNKQQSND